MVRESRGKSLEVNIANKIVDEFAFARQVKLHSATVRKGNFLRKGVVGEWVNNFSAASK